MAGGATRSGLALAALIASAAAAGAASLEVVPTLLELPAKGGATQLRLVNHGDKAVEVQVEGFAWTQDRGETLSDSDAIVLSPPQAHLEPHATQIVRLLVTSAAQVERAFRVVATELPDPRERANGARVLLQFSVPLFAGDGAADSAHVVWTLRASGELLARNDGARRGKYTGLTLVAGDGTRRAVSPQSLVYVLSGAARSWAVPAMSPGESLRLEGYDDIAGKRFSLALTAGD